MNDSTYPLPIGTKLPEGKITGLTDTAYEVEPKGRCHTCGTPNPETFRGTNCPPDAHGLGSGRIFVPFTKVHPLVPASPLVVLR